MLALCFPWGLGARSPTIGLPTQRSKRPTRPSLQREPETRQSRTRCKLHSALKARHFAFGPDLNRVLMAVVCWSRYEYGTEMASQRIIHLAADAKTHRRILTHAYLFLHMADRAAQRAHLRFVRDRFHYRTPIFCSASKAVHKLEAAEALSPDPKAATAKTALATFLDGAHIGDAPGRRGYSSLHIRRGDFQYKQVLKDY